MKTLFAIAFGVLVLASVAIRFSLPDQRSPVPVLYWVTDANPARGEQVARFHQWLAKNHYPPMELRVDSANRDVSKMIIQGVSGVGGDIFDIWTGSGMRYFHDMGLLADITGPARELGFDASQTYPAMRPEITLNGRQYMFPCNVVAHQFWINRATFAKYQLPVPPRRWTFAEFEEAGKRFVAAANPPGQRRTVFFANAPALSVWRRSLGLDTFNETLTRCALDDERNARVLELMHRWTYTDHLFPTSAEIASAATAAGYGGVTLQLFNSGRYGMFWMGRYALVQLREFGPLELAVAEPPHGGFPNTTTGTRAAAIYAGSKHPELAKYFLAYLASEDYNMQIVADADGLPPNPKYTETEAFRHPPSYPQEWGCHEAFADLERNIAIGGSYSPFVLPVVADRIVREVEEGFMAGLYTAHEAGRVEAQRINDEIQRSVAENPKLRAEYDRLVARQRSIESLRADGKPVPRDWIENPFHQRYYEAQKWSE